MVKPVSRVNKGIWFACIYALFLIKMKPMQQTAEIWIDQKKATLQHLNMFTGKWEVSGRNSKHAPSSLGSSIEGEEHYEWMPGKYFLINKWKHGFAEGNHSGISILGFDEKTAELYCHSFDNGGFERRYP